MFVIPTLLRSASLMDHSRWTKCVNFGFKYCPGIKTSWRGWKLIINAKSAMFPMDGALKRIRSNPADADAHCKLGLLLRAEGKKQEAWDHFQTASSAKPEFDEPHVYLGEML